MIKTLCSNNLFHLSLSFVFATTLLGCDSASTPAEDQSVISAFQDGLNAPILTTTPAPTGTGNSVIVATAEPYPQTGAQTKEKTIEEIKIEVPVPTATLAPVSVPPYQTLNSTNLPPIEQDLVFVRLGVFERWSAENQTISPIFTPVISPDRFAPDTFAEIDRVDFSADGKRAAIVVKYSEPKGQSDDQSGDTESLNFTDMTVQFDIIFIDIISQESWTLVEGIDENVGEIALSPDKSSVVFTTHPHQTEPAQNDGKIFMIASPASQADRPLTQLQDCNMRCGAIRWRQDSELMVFEDQTGIYIMSIDGARPTLLFKNIDNSDENRSPLTRHLPVEWALNGRSLLVKQVTKHDKEAKNVVLDVANSQLIETDNDQSLNSATWLDDSRLISAVQLDSEEWAFQTFIVDFENQELRQDEEYRLSFKGTISNIGQTADNRFVFSLQNTDHIEKTGIYRLVSFSEQPERLNGLPNIAHSPDILWNENGSEAIQAFGNQTFLATTDGNLFVLREHVWGLKWMGE